MVGYESALVCSNSWDDIVNDLNALEQAIEDVCNAGTIARIKERKEKIKGAKQ